MWSLELIRNKIGILSQRFKSFFKPETHSSRKKLQFFWAGCVVLGTLGISSLIFLYMFNDPLTPIAQKESTPTLIESGYTKAGSEGAWRYTIDTSLQTLTETVKALQSTLTEVAQEKAQTDAIRDQDLEMRLADMENTLFERLKATGVPQENSGSPSLEPLSETLTQNLGIHKFTLNLSENQKLKQQKTVETTIPAGAFAQTILLSGLDASAAMNASSDPRPMLLRVIDYGTLPRMFQSDLKDCHCTASAFGDISSERVYARLEKLTCIDRSTGEIIETQVAGYIAGPDGKAGIRGIVASKDGQFLSRSLMGGMFSGLSNVANPQSRRGMTNPFALGGAGVPPISMGENFTSGMASGASSALDRLSQYYIDRAEQLQPVIQIAAGQVVDIVFTEGTLLGSQTIKQDIEKTRGSSSTQPTSSPPAPQQEGL
jgi:conjugal transfer pilus assembly protein TraB